MADISEDELEYLQSGFDANSLTMPRLRQALMTHDIPYNSSAKKSELVDIFNSKLRPKAKRILSSRAKIRRTSAGIESVPDSQSASINGEEEDDDEILDLPEPIRDTRSRRTTRSSRASTADVSEDPTPRQTPARRRATRTPAESSVSVEPEPPRSVARPSKKSELRELAKDNSEIPRRVVSTESPFSADNPFQSGSSPLPEEEPRRKSSGRKSEGSKSVPRRSRTAEPVIKQETDDTAFTTSRTVNIPARALRRSNIKQEAVDLIEAGEEFTPEEEQALIQESAARGDTSIARSRKKKAKKQSSALRTAPYAIIATLMAAYVVWWRKEKIEVGYCGIGKPAITLQEMQIPEALDFLQPKCEPCPQHAYCYTDMETKCEKDFILRHHPLSLNGLIPLVPSCEPDGEKARKVKAVADRAIEELRERRAKFECGELTEGDGKKATVVEIPEPSLKAAVSAKRRKAMSDEEFEDLWNGAIGEIKGREEVTADAEGLSGKLFLSSSSLARISISCSIRRSFRATLAKYRIYLGFVLTISFLILYIRNYFKTLRNDNARVPALVSMVLDRLATQAALHEQGSISDQFMSLGQLRDDVLRDEFSASRRERIWKKVQAVVERNANVRASVREGRSGDVSRQWEWIGSTDSVDESRILDRRRSGRYSIGLALDDTPISKPSQARSDGEPTQRRWDEGRPIY